MMIAGRSVKSAWMQEAWKMESSECASPTSSIAKGAK
jgi:hypothetical protein